MRKLKSSLLTALFVSITTLFIFGCTNPAGSGVTDSTVLPSERPEDIPGHNENPQFPDFGGGNNSVVYSYNFQVTPTTGNSRPLQSELVFNKEISLDVRILDQYQSLVSLSDFEIINKSQLESFFDISLEKRDWDGKYYYIVNLKVKSVPTVAPVLQFKAKVNENIITSQEIRIIASSSSGGNGGFYPTPNPGNGGNGSGLQVGQTIVIPHNYEKEHVYWLGGIEKPTKFLEYKAAGQKVPELDEFGKVIPGSFVEAGVDVPNYYVVDTSKMAANGSTSTPEYGKATWYNVTKSMNDDTSLCWAMASAGALQWWFDYLGEDYTNKLFEIRKNRNDMPEGNANAEFLFKPSNEKGLNAGDIHYTPLPGEAKMQEIFDKTGIGQYARKAFGDVGGEPLDLFRLYFFDEDLNTNGTAHLESNYVRRRSLGLLHGMNASFSGWLDGNDNLFVKDSISNRPKDDIVAMFKQAIKEKAAIVLYQANIPDEGMADNYPGTKARHAIIVWGVIFDETEENIVGLYVGDNNLPDGNLARVDLVFKQLSPQGGRYYYASPFVDQTNPNYLKSTSIHTIAKLYPPTERVTKWIGDMYNKHVTKN